ncbi:isochorismatase family protein [Streptomyces sp. AM 4-1-1]|uniref:isochorismatase family protein n=1 Tax=Streptomyces sp. AM 4-1-1 TaxID=3028710 RepID=UPI0023B94D4B|nr:isochorismatase family protein [Streptomyces sp. AM 4-1-1]WEH36697.1 isochorismatase family protein [Streptomyces sp. AM 4-1-1]
MGGLPSFVPYPMPAEESLPANTAPWIIDPSRAVLLIHDMQRYFLRPFRSAGSPGSELVENCVLLRERCAELGMPVAYTAQPGGMTDHERGLLSDFWGPGMRVSPDDRRVVAPLEPRTDDWVFTKWRYSAFFKSDLLERMRADGRDQLIVCGVYAHVGVLMTSVDAFTHNIQPFLAADAVADFSEKYHRMALTYAAERCAVVTTTRSALGQLAPAGASGR